MSGTKQRATETASVSSTSFLGILYAEDFDEPSDKNPNPDRTRDDAEPLPPLTQADLDAACAAAVQTARLEWQHEVERERTTALATLGNILTGIRDTCEQAALAAAEGTVTTILSMITGLLPEFSREHGPTEVRGLLGRLLPTIRSQTKITVRVHPDLVPAVLRDVGELEPDLASMIVVTPGSLNRADVRVAWENGSMTRDSHQIMQAIQDVLSQLGLHQKVEAPTKRTMAYAD